MDPMPIILTVCMLTMLSASVSDIRNREVSDIHWAAIGMIGIAAILADGGTAGILAAAGSAMFLIDMLFDLKLNGIRHATYLAISASLFAAAMAVNNWYDAAKYASIPLCIILFHVMYRTGVLYGGADAKCLMSLSILFPVYPAGYSVIPASGPEVLMSAFPLSVLLLAALFTVAAAIPIAVRNLMTEDDVGLGNVLMVRMEVSKARTSKVWPRQDIIDGRLEYVRAADDGTYDRLESNGIKRIWVSPMVPFIVPITAALMAETLIGNPILMV